MLKVFGESNTIIREVSFLATCNDRVAPLFVEVEQFLDESYGVWVIENEMIQSTTC